MAKITAFGLSIDTDNITTAHKLIVGGVVALLILGGGGYSLLYPQWETLQTLESEIAEQESQIEKKTSDVAALPALKKELVEIKERLVLLRRKIPTSTNVASLLLDIEEVSENKALYGNAAVLNEFRPQEIVDFTLPPELQDASESEAAKQLKQLPVTIKLSKVSYPDLIELLQDYEHYERTLSLDNLSITPQEDQNALYTPVDVSFTLKAFLLGG